MSVARVGMKRDFDTNMLSRTVLDIRPAQILEMYDNRNTGRLAWSTLPSQSLRRLSAPLTSAWPLHCF